ncbi:MAG: hypothetical protein HYY86_00350 [Candidatus Harrisonbacteria bacterium]|nr:hypothetical protein [Candidatus Harrisonbacteria bacterium]
MNNKYLIIIFSVAVLAFLIWYSSLNSGRFLSPAGTSPVFSPPALSAEEKARILSTLNAKHKETLTPQQKTKILNSLTAPF